MVTLLASVFDGSVESYFLAGCIGCMSFPVIALLLFGLIWLIDKILDYLHYLKKRKQVFDKLYPQYEELMKGENEDASIGS